MYTNKRKNVAVIFGGRSAEHDVSIITGHSPIIDSLLVTGKYNVIPILKIIVTTSKIRIQNKRKISFIE